MEDVAAGEASLTLGAAAGELYDPDAGEASFALGDGVGDEATGEASGEYAPYDPEFEPEVGEDAFEVASAGLASVPDAIDPAEPEYDEPPLALPNAPP